ncbi:MAG: hypothetical protein IJ242_09160, partial [Clostridia bacterium]|nr:hypothetical protein [Clostridia bacterium]
EKLKQISHPLQAVIEAVGKKKLKLELLTPCGDCILQILKLLQRENAFKAVRKAGRLYRENHEKTREAVEAIAEAEHCSEQTA